MSQQPAERPAAECERRVSGGAGKMSRESKRRALKGGEEKLDKWGGREMLLGCY